MAEQRPTIASTKEQGSSDRADRAIGATDPTIEVSRAIGDRTAIVTPVGTTDDRRRSAIGRSSPRRYDQPIEDDDDPVMPSSRRDAELPKI